MNFVPPEHGSERSSWVSIVIGILVVIVTIWVGTMVASPIEATMPTINSSSNLTGIPWEQTAPSFLPVVIILIAIGFVLLYIRIVE